MSEIIDTLVDAVVGGDTKGAKAATKACLEAGIDAETIVFDALSRAMDIVGGLYTSRRYILPQVLRSANALYQGLNLCIPLLKGDVPSSKGTVILAVVEGDVHDIGKNIVKAVLTGYGLNVIDIGKDISVKEIIDTAVEKDADIIATSTLMTSTLSEMEQIEADLKEMGIKGKVMTMIGGGATTKEFAERIDADGWSRDATEAPKVASKLLGL